MSAQAVAEGVAAIEAATEGGLKIDVEAASAILRDITQRVNVARPGNTSAAPDHVSAVLLLAILDEQRRTREAFEALGTAVSEITSGGILNLLRKGGA